MKLAIHCIACVVLGGISTVWGGCLPETKDSNGDVDASILSFENELDKLNEFNFGFETSDGVDVMQHGEIKDPNTEMGHLETQGEYSYIGPDGVEYKVEYTAGENGFRPKYFLIQNVRISKENN